MNLTDRYILSFLFARGTAGRVLYSVPEYEKALVTDLGAGARALPAARRAYFLGLLPSDPTPTEAIRVSSDLLPDVKGIRASLKRLCDLGYVRMDRRHPSKASRFPVEMFGITEAGEAFMREKLIPSLPSRPGYFLKDVDVRTAAYGDDVGVEPVLCFSERGFPVKVRRLPSGALQGVVPGTDLPEATRTIRG